MSRPGSGIRGLAGCTEVVLVFDIKPSEFSRLDRSRRRPSGDGILTRVARHHIHAEAGPGGFALFPTQPLEVRGPRGDSLWAQRQAFANLAGRPSPCRQDGDAEPPPTRIPGDPRRRTGAVGLGAINRQGPPRGTRVGEAPPIEFQNKFWVTRVPENPAVAAVLGTLSEASEMNRLVQDIAEESAAISRILELSAARRIQKNAARLNILLAIVAIPTIILGLAALYADPSQDLATDALKLSARGRSGDTCRSIRVGSAGQVGLPGSTEPTASAGPLSPFAAHAGQKSSWRT